jgi:anti-anti-sigma factor
MATWSDLDELLGAAVSDGARRVMIDLSAVDYIDAHSIGLIVAAWTAAEDRGLSLRIDGMRGFPKDLFIILGLEALMATLGVDDVWVDDVRRPDVGE